MGRDKRLDEELAYYDSRKADLLASHAGFFVLIKGSMLVGVYPTAEAAYEHGLDEFGLEPFLVKRVIAVELVGFIPAFDAIPIVDL